MMNHLDNNRSPPPSTNFTSTNATNANTKHTNSNNHMKIDSSVLLSSSYWNNTNQSIDNNNSIIHEVSSSSIMIPSLSHDNNVDLYSLPPLLSKTNNNHNSIISTTAVTNRNHQHRPSFMNKKRQFVEISNTTTNSNKTIKMQQAGLIDKENVVVVKPTIELLLSSYHNDKENDDKQQQCNISLSNKGTSNVNNENNNGHYQHQHHSIPSISLFNNSSSNHFSPTIHHENDNKKKNDCSFQTENSNMSLSQSLDEDILNDEDADNNDDHNHNNDPKNENNINSSNKKQKHLWNNNSSSQLVDNDNNRSVLTTEESYYELPKLPLSSSLLPLFLPESKAANTVSPKQVTISTTQLLPPLLSSSSLQQTTNNDPAQHNNSYYNGNSIINNITSPKVFKSATQLPPLLSSLQTSNDLKSSQNKEIEIKQQQRHPLSDSTNKVLEKANHDAHGNIVVDDTTTTTSSYYSSTLLNRYNSKNITSTNNTSSSSPLLPPSTKTMTTSVTKKPTLYSSRLYQRLNRQNNNNNDNDHSNQKLLLVPKRNLGLPQRVVTTTTMIAKTSMPDDNDDDSSSNSNNCSMTSNPKILKEVENHMVESQHIKKPKLNKTDLSYMWEWDPMKRNNNNQYDDITSLDSHQSSNDNDNANKRNHHEQPSIDNNDCSNSKKSNESITTASSSSTTTSVSASTSASSGSAFKTAGLNQNNNNNNNNSNIIMRGSANVSQSIINPSSNANDTSVSLSKINRDFISLVSEDNMIRINKVDYAKLCVMGKGASCTVYSALSSKDYRTVAIKKVNLDGLDRKAVAGYSNEIKLLQRLSGNPSIIQLYDSEVDYDRKAIFLVMEVGEVDLNHVLQKQLMEQQQQPGSSSKITSQQEHKTNQQRRRQLNLNFIRLTWQQMLTAVHSMHEERIIHGDLKPANFLFVRGALKLIDFGIAKAIQTDDTTSVYHETHIGTVNYMSPESLLVDTSSSSKSRRMKCGRPSDIWSLGCILYQMIYGKTPFYDLHLLEKIHAIPNPNYQILYQHPITMNRVDETSSGYGQYTYAIDAIQRCLQRNPIDRSPIIGTPNGLLNEHLFING